jgi:hypothetical protein
VRLACALALACAPLLGQEPARPPNIVLVLADDLGYGDPACYNDASRIPTPHVDPPLLEDERATLPELLRSKTSSGPRTPTAGAGVGCASSATATGRAPCSRCRSRRADAGAYALRGPSGSDQRGQGPLLGRRSSASARQSTLRVTSR